MRRRTKIVATLGPATDAPGRIEQLVLAGMNVARVNFSHATHDEHRRRIAAVRAVAESTGREVAIMVDLQGPKIRIEGFADGPVHLEDGAEFTLDTALGAHEGTAERVGISYPALTRDVGPGDVLLLNDGVIRLEVEAIGGTAVQCRVVSGGPLSDRKGINRLGGGLSAETLTDKDREDVKLAAEIGADFVAVSFPRSAQDMDAARALCETHGLDAHLIAKIERAEALDELEAITEASDGVMVARGDLGVEIGDAELPAVQKRLIALARDLNRVVITATQMMESMITQPIPTRAEVLDVANAVMDGTDAVMLSAETAAGEWPEETVAIMDRIVTKVEQDEGYRARMKFLETKADPTTADALSHACSTIAETVSVAAITVFTFSGSTARRVARERPSVPMLVLTPQKRVARRVALLWGAHAVVTRDILSFEEMIGKGKRMALRHGFGQAGSKLIALAGVPFGTPGSTNLLHVVPVSGDELEKHGG